MSNQTYNLLWHKTQHDLEKNAVSDFDYQQLEPQADRHSVQITVFEIYAKYVTISNRLEEIYDQILQPQKRTLIRKLLDSCLGRVVELKMDLVGLDISEFSYNEDILEKLKLTPLDLEVRIPRYFIRERASEINERKRFMDDILKKIGFLEGLDEEEEEMTEMDAIRIIQMHERARQGRLRAQFMKEIKFLKEKGKPDSAKDRAETGLMAALRIQKMWRGFATRRQTRQRKMREMVLIGMIPPPPTAKQEKPVDEVEIAKQHRYELQEKYQRDYEESLKNVKDEISTKQGAQMQENIADEIRNWFKEYNRRTGKFPEFPAEELGGSRHLLSRQGTESEISRSSALSSKDSKKDKNAKGKDGKPQIKSGDINLEDSIEAKFKPGTSMFLPEMKVGIDEYNEVWKNKDETENFKQTYYEDMVFSDKYSEIENELRKIVDDIMRNELDLLQAALDKDRAAKGKKTKKGAKKARRGGKKGKKKKEKDLTPDRTTESLFEELVMNGIIRKYPDTPINSYLGDPSYNVRTSLNPTPGDIRAVLIQHCVLPLGSEQIRQFVPCIKSVLLAGPKGSGKRTLVNAICTEVGAVLFDLSPANIVGKYPGKSGLIMLMHLISKVTRLLQPAVIYFGDAEKPYMKKVPKTDRTDPKRLKKDLPKLIKNISPEDRVILLGTTQFPWEADQKALQQTYNRFIYLPRPDYGTLSFTWKELLSQYSGVHRQFDTGIMAKISDGYTVGAIVKTIQEVITCKRMLQLRVQPLTHVELINALR